MGHLEYWQRCNDETFQWGKLNSYDPTPELYPFAVCELPVNFTRLARAIYDVAKTDSQLIFCMEYVNITGFVLRPGVPNSRLYMMPSSWVQTRPYSDKDLMTDDNTVPADFDPDPVAFALVEEVYRQFGIPRKYIPCFDKQRHFDIKVNSAED